VSLAQIHNAEYHEYIGLQRNNKYMKYRPQKMQRQLIQTQQGDQNEHQFTGVHIAEQS
jgi:hypothetical protein